MNNEMKKKYILPFDHRGSFAKGIFSKSKLDEKEKQIIKNYKKIIFEGFLSVWSAEPKNEKNKFGIFIDEEYGEDIIKKAIRKKIQVCLSTEKSGQKVFGLEYGKNFDKHILKFNPEYVKTLVRYNPKDDKKKNEGQLKKIKKIHDWCQKNNFKFITELLVPPIGNDLKKKKDNYDTKTRPVLTRKAIQDFYKAGIVPNIWKIEAMEDKKTWKAVIKKVRSGVGKERIGIIMLGRGESVAKVKQWIKNCPKNQINGFAIGRTVWWRSIYDLHNNKINKKQAIQQISANFLEFIKIWEK